MNHGSVLQRRVKAMGCVQSRHCFEECHAAQRRSPLPPSLLNPIGSLQRLTLLVTRTYRVCANDAVSHKGFRLTGRLLLLLAEIGMDYAEDHCANAEGFINRGIMS